MTPLAAYCIDILQSRSAEVISANRYLDNLARVIPLLTISQRIQIPLDLPDGGARATFAKQAGLHRHGNVECACGVVRVQVRGPSIVVILR